MRQFNAAPGWPDPPTARWRPPKHWRPSESWPPAPADWPFWVNEAGQPVRGPIGRYGGPSRSKVAAFAAVPLALIAVALFNPFDSGGGGTMSTLPVDTSEPTPAPTSAPTTDPTSPTASPLTSAPTSAPASTRATATSPATTPRRTASPATPTPAASPTPSSTSAPTPAPTAPSPTASRTTPTPTAIPATTTAAVYQTCAEARAAGKAPLHRGQPGYSEALDHNGDGVACDRGNS